jgi:hypothetical protein
MPDPRIHAVRRNWIEEVLRKVPGFRGYLEKEYRRDSDELQRRWLADRLQQSKAALERLSRSLVDAGKIDPLPAIDRVRSRLDTLATRIRGAVRGYSGFFDLVEVDAALLDHVYEFDVHLATDVELLAKKIEDMPNQLEQLEKGLAEALAEIDAVERRFAGREEMLKGLAH